MQGGVEPQNVGHEYHYASDVVAIRTHKGDDPKNQTLNVIKKN